MRYYSDSNTLFIRGSFRAASTGISGGIHSVSTILSHVVSEKSEIERSSEKELEFAAAGAGIDSDFFGLLTSVPVQHLSVLQYDFITVFITAFIPGTGDQQAGSINIIVFSAEGMEDAALLESIIVSTEAKTETLLASGYTISGTAGDSIITACEGPVRHASAGRNTEAGRRIREAVMHGIPEALQRNRQNSGFDRPSYFIFSRFKGEHWVEWTPENCSYFPCHFPGQRCDFCYCPFYPCYDEDLGQWAESSNGKKVWNCARCTLLHEPVVTDYLKRFPGVSLKELVRRRKSGKEK
jgi:adenosylcobinamide hydrolase